MCSQKKNDVRFGSSHLRRELELNPPPDYHAESFPGASLLQNKTFAYIKRRASEHTQHKHTHLYATFGGNEVSDFVSGKSDFGHL